MTQLRIGISGWTYPRWRGNFYPPALPHRRELEYASRQLNSIEINGSFYSLQRPESYRQWRDQTPEDFVFAVKGGRFITHMKKLRDIEIPLANFFASGVLALGEKLGPILWQFPPMLGFLEERFESFLELLPRDTEAASDLASLHDSHLEGRALTKPELRTGRKRLIRHAFEIRHPSFLTPRFMKLLRRFDAALVIADTAGKFPFSEELTSDFVYVRLHGETELYASGYSDASLSRWAGKLRRWRREGRDIFTYFDNDAKVHAPFDAMSLAARAGGYHPLHEQQWNGKKAA